MVGVLTNYIIYGVTKTHFEVKKLIGNNMPKTFDRTFLRNYGINYLGFTASELSAAFNILPKQ